MLSVHNYHQPFQPVPAHPTSTRRHHQAFMERGRSRTVSQAALARKESEERRRRAAIAAAAINVDVGQPTAATSRATPSTISKPRQSSIHTNTSTSSKEASYVASSTSRLSLPSSSSSNGTILSPNFPDHAYDSSADVCDSRRRRRVTIEPYPIPVSESSSIFDEEDDASAQGDSLSLQDQMQQAYARCQTTCLPTLGQNHCQCPSMHRARVLYLKTQGIEVSSNDDPRIEQVRDEDFVFIPGGRLVLDEESLVALNEERERREKEALQREWRGHRQTFVARPGSTRSVQACVLQYDEKPKPKPQSLEFWARRDHPNSAIGIYSRPCSDILRLASSRVEPVPTDRSSHQIGIDGAVPRRVSFDEIVRSLDGCLFPDSEPQRARSLSQSRLLDSLLEAVTWREDERRQTRNKANICDEPRTWTETRSLETVEPCMSCSVSSESTISRTNSWTSTTSDTSVSTCITTPSSSPSSTKPQLAPLVEDRAFRRRAVQCHCSPQHSRRTIVILDETPLMQFEVEGSERKQSFTKAVLCSSHEGSPANVKSALVTKVRQTVYGLIDFACRMQQSYLRTIQFAVALQSDASHPMQHPPLQCSSTSHANDRNFKPSGYRVSPLEVQRFSPRPVLAPTRGLDFPSEVNIPLVDPSQGSGSTTPVRVFAPLAFVPPSPLRPRDPPAAPEWRLRPVANPCTLRLKAHANRLCEKGIAWEGRAHTGSLGCGRERLTGVAFEGLGGSRLAFEVN